MKKVIFALVAAGMTMTSCMNDEFPNATSYGQLNVNVSNDLQMNTRASVTDLSTWTVKANDGTSDISLTTASTKVKAGKYTVSAQSHASEAAALAANSGWGAAYYEGTAAPVEVTAGSEKDVTVECGTAKNARLKVQFSLISNFTEYSLTAVTAPNRNLVFNASNSSTALAYYGATEVVNYTLSYKYNGTLKEIPGQITMKGAATENIISIASNDNGTISVTVNYDDTFGTGNSENLVFDAATGEKIS
jgi:phage baseplate assembly protein gpV